MTDGFSNKAHLTEVTGTKHIFRTKKYTSLPQLLSQLNISSFPLMRMVSAFTGVQSLTQGEAVNLQRI